MALALEGHSPTGPTACLNSGTKVAQGVERVGWVLGLLPRLSANESLVGRNIGQGHEQTLAGSHF